MIVRGELIYDAEALRRVFHDAALLPPACAIARRRGRIAWLVEEDSTGFGRMVSNWRAGSR